MTLREILGALEKFVGETVNNLHPTNKADFINQLEIIRSDLSHGIAGTQKEYRRLVHRFYKRHNPFGSGNVEQDLVEYRLLLIHALAAGDVVLFSLSGNQSPALQDDGNKCLLDTWGVDFPLNKPNVLAGKFLQWYSEVFNHLCQDEQWEHFRQEYNLPNGARIYYEYLSRKMSQNS